MNFMKSFTKIAVDELARQALNEATAPMEAAVPGSSLKPAAETGQRRKGSGRTSGVLNEDRDMNPKLKINWQNSRFP